MDFAAHNVTVEFAKRHKQLQEVLGGGGAGAWRLLVGSMVKLPAAPTLAWECTVPVSIFC